LILIKGRDEDPVWYKKRPLHLSMVFNKLWNLKEVDVGQQGLDLSFLEDSEIKNGDQLLRQT
jgi:hypothetical protein